MKTIYLNKPLGMGVSYAPAKKEWVLTALSTAGALASSLFGGAKASEAARENERALRADKAKKDAWYNVRYYQDYVDTAAGANLVRRAKQIHDRGIKQATGAQAVAGGTAAATQMAKDSANRAVGDTIANISALDTQRKDRVDAQHRIDEQNYTQQKMAIENQRAQAITNAAQNASNAMMQAAGAFESSQSLSGGSNKGVDTSATPSFKVGDVNKPDSNQTVYTGKVSGISAPVDDWRNTVFGNK